MSGAKTRWESRSAWATCLRLVVLLGPVVASVAAAWACRTLLPSPSGATARLAVLAALLGVSTLTLVVVDRLGRRLLPVVTLLDLSMLFPDQAPSRLAVAREAVRRRPIEEQLARVRDAGADPGAVAREILTLVAAMRAHDRPTRGHAERVRMFTDLLAEQLHVPRRDRDLLRSAAILHDIGKLRIPSTLLNKPGKPTEAEWVLLKAHPSTARRSPPACSRGSASGPRSWSPTTSGTTAPGTRWDCAAAGSPSVPGSSRSPTRTT